MHRLRGHPVLTFLALVMAMTGSAALLLGQRYLVINTSPSVAPGIYIGVNQEPGIGALVDFQVPHSARCYVFDRTGHDGSNWYILKPIIAGAGDLIDTTGPWLAINGQRVAPMTTHDSAGRALPVWRARRLLNEGEFFVFSDRIANSFDSRHYGPIRREQIDAVRKPAYLW